MKKSHVVLFGILIVCLTFFLFVSQRYQVPNAASVESRETVSKPQSKSISLPATNLKRRNLSSTKAHANKIMTENARLMTPAFMRQLVDYLMKSRDKDYQLLFRKWSISDDEAQEALQIIQDRELQIKEALRTYRLEGMGGGKDLSETIAVIHAISDKSLRELLGNNRMTDLVQLEVQMNARLADKGMNIVGHKIPD